MRHFPLAAQMQPTIAVVSLLLTLATATISPWLAPLAADDIPVAEPESDAPIDSILQRAHRQADITAAETCDDRVFIRRVMLDLLGRTPTRTEWAAFADDPDREKLLDQLLLSPEFPTYWSQLWATILVGRGQQNRTDREALRLWLQQAFSDGVPLDQVAYDLIASQGVTVLNGQVNFLTGNREDPVTPVCRIFLGVQMDCARCHDHPYDRWTQQDYVRMRRFFQTVQFKQVSGGVEVFDNVIPDNDPKQSPQFLTGAHPKTAAWRKEFALLTVRCKPFARAMGNRIWQLLIGRGIVTPVDGLSSQHPPSVPALHNALAEQLRSQQFDLRRLIKTICMSDAYARIGLRTTALEPIEYELFAARRPRPLLPEQLVASYWIIQNSAPLSSETWNRLSVEFAGRATAKTGASDPLDIERTSQGLLRELASATRPLGGDIDTVFETTLGRPPTTEERQTITGTPTADLLYALLHCNEFVFSH